MNQELVKRMTHRRKGQLFVPLAIFTPNENYIVAVYQGGLSTYDIIIRYRQKLKNNAWSSVRTPRHIHWAVDILTKLNANQELTQQFLDFLIEAWNETVAIKTEEARIEALNIDLLLNHHHQEIVKYSELDAHGEYSIEFLILLAKLLMIMEKTNFEGAYMFGNLLHMLREGQDIYAIVSSAARSRH